jgi:hypothetical protein
MVEEHLSGRGGRGEYNPSDWSLGWGGGSAETFTFNLLFGATSTTRVSISPSIGAQSRSASGNLSSLLRAGSITIVNAGERFSPSFSTIPATTYAEFALQGDARVGLARVPSTYQTSPELIVTSLALPPFFTYRKVALLHTCTSGTSPDGFRDRVSAGMSEG